MSSLQRDRDPGPSSVDLLSQISQQLAAFKRTVAPKRHCEPFVCSCALLATLLQQWARRYLLITQIHGSKLHGRARVRSFFRGRCDKITPSRGCQSTPGARSYFCLFLFLGTSCLQLRHPSHPLLPNHPPPHLVLWVYLFGVDAHADPSSQQSVPGPSVILGLVLLYALSAGGQRCIGLFNPNRKPGLSNNLR